VIYRKKNPLEAREKGGVMKLDKYLEKKGLSAEKAAEELGITRQHMQSLRMYRSPAGRKLAGKIIAWSGGEVGYDDLWPPGYKFPSAEERAKQNKERATPAGPRRARSRKARIEERLELVEKQLARLVPLGGWTPRPGGTSADMTTR
jgi:hypothetical protein